MTDTAHDVGEIREWVADHRACCGRLLSFQIVDRALGWLDGAPITSTHFADRSVIETMSPDDSDYATRAAETARFLYREIDAHATR